MKILLKSKYSDMVILGLVLLGSSAASIALIVGNQRDSLIGDLYEKTLFLANAISDEAKVNILLEDIDGLENVATKIANSSNYAIRISFYNSDSKRLWSNFPAAELKIYSGIEAYKAVVSGEFLYLKVNLYNRQNESIGYLLLKSELSEINGRITLLSQRIGTIALLLIIIILVSNLQFKRKIKKSLKDKSLSIAKMELAQKNNEEQKKFMATINHELRTPLNAILGFSKLLHEETLSSTGKKYLDIVISTSRAMEYLVNEILDYSKITHDALSFNNNDFCLSKTVEEAIHICSHKQKPEVELRFKGRPGPLALKGDANRVRQIIVNLVTNALKFTQKGYVKVEYNMVSKGEDYAIHFEVADTGIGISEEKINSLFRPFNQAHNTTKFKVESTGLGLSITKRIIEKMGGEITVESKLGQGSTFCVDLVLPAGNPNRCNEEELQKDLTSSNLSGKVLIAEDNRVNQILIQKLLEKFDLEITMASNGLEAIQKAVEDSFDLILMDIEMPIMGGMEALKRLQKISIQVPILACTANASSESKKEYLDAGFDGYITKPIDLENLTRELQKFLISTRIEA